MFRYLTLIGLVGSCIFSAGEVQALETGDDLKLDPDRYLGKKVSLLGVIDASYEPLKAPSGAGSFYVMNTGKNVRQSSGNISRTVFNQQGKVVVFVPNGKITSFVNTFKRRLENNYNYSGKGFSGIYLKRDKSDDEKEWRGWRYWYSYHKGYYVDMTGN